MVSSARMSRRSALTEVAMVYVTCCFWVVLVTSAAGWPYVGPFVEAEASSLIAIGFVVAAYFMADRSKRQLADFGLQLGGLAERSPENAIRILDLARTSVRECGAALIVVALVFPPFVLAFYLWNTPSHAFAWTKATPAIGNVLTQLAVVAFPEEALFRGYVQSRLGDVWRTRTKFLGVDVNLAALIIQAALFALVHMIVIRNPARLAVFFPALLFGWVRAWRSGIGAAIVVHAMSNLLSELLHQGYRL